MNKLILILLLFLLNSCWNSSTKDESTQSNNHIPPESESERIINFKYLSGEWKFHRILYKMETYLGAPLFEIQEKIVWREKNYSLENNIIHCNLKGKILQYRIASAGLCYDSKAHFEDDEIEEEEIDEIYLVDLQSAESQKYVLIYSREK